MTDASTATLLLSCQDRPGIAAAVTKFLFDNGTNIMHAEQHWDTEAGIFFQRVQADLANATATIEELRERFEPVAAEFDMDYSIRHSSERPRVAVLCSKQGHCIYDLLARWSLSELPGEFVLVASNHDTHRQVTEQAGVPFHHLPVDVKDRAAQQQGLLDLLTTNDIDLVVMARYMQILPESIIDAFPNRIINIHHSFLPAFPGGKPYHQAHARGVKLIGVTAHYATADLDEGPIIDQDVTRVSHRQSPTELVQKGRDLETVVLARAVKAHLENRILAYQNKTVVFG